MNLDGYAPGPLEPKLLPTEDRWLLDGLDRLAAAVTADLDQFGFAEAARRLRDFTWNDFCDWYLEFVKARLRDPAARPTAQRVLAAALDRLCRLLHPFLPFVTEQVWQALNDLAAARGLPEPRPAEASVCIAAWPVQPVWTDQTARAVVEQWREKITALRNLRAEHGIPPTAKIAPTLIATGATAEALRQGEPFLRGLAGAGSITIAPAAERHPDAAVAVLPDCELILPLAGLIDQQAEAAKHAKTLADLDKQLGLARAKLANEAFVARAPAAVVAQHRAKLADLETQRAAVAALLARLAAAPGNADR
jgi:valyl-tRNA synthetase